MKGWAAHTPRHKSKVHRYAIKIAKLVIPTLTAKRVQALADRSFSVRASKTTQATAAIARPARVIEAPSWLHGALVVVFQIPATKITVETENRTVDSLPNGSAFDELT